MCPTISSSRGVPAAPPCNGTSLNAVFKWFNCPPCVTLSFYNQNLTWRVYNYPSANIKSLLPSFLKLTANRQLSGVPGVVGRAPPHVWWRAVDSCCFCSSQTPVKLRCLLGIFLTFEKNSYCSITGLTVRSSGPMNNTMSRVWLHWWFICNE